MAVSSALSLSLPEEGSWGAAQERNGSCTLEMQCKVDDNDDGTQEITISGQGGEGRNCRCRGYEPWGLRLEGHCVIERSANND